MGKLTLEQIADLAGVSRSTVSRVISHHPNVRPEVGERVQEVIAETGYHPDPAARSLATRRSGIIGLVIPRAIQFLFTGPYYPRLMQGIAQAVETLIYMLTNGPQPPRRITWSTELIIRSSCAPGLEA